MALVHNSNYAVRLADYVGERRPPGARIKLVLRLKQSVSTHHTREDAVFLDVQVGTCRPGPILQWIP